MFFRLKPIYLIAIFCFFASLPFAVHFIFHDYVVYFALFDWLGLFDDLAPIPLFFAIGNFLIIRKRSAHRFIPTVAAIIIGLCFMKEISWGLDYTPVGNTDFTNYMGFMAYVFWIHIIVIYIGAAYLALTFVLQFIPLARRKLSERGWPFPSWAHYICLITFVASIYFDAKLPYHGYTSRIMPDFLACLWIFFISAEEGIGK